MNLEKKLFDYLDISASTINKLNQTNFLRPFLKYLIIEELTKDLEVPQDILENSFNNFCLTNGLDNKAKVNNFLQINFLTYQELIDQITHPLKKNVYMLSEYGHLAENLYLKRKDDLDKIIFSQICVKDRNSAYDIYLKLESRESSFGEIKNLFRKNKEFIFHEKVGPINTSSLEPKMKEFLLQQTEDEFQEPILIDDFWVILRLDKKIDTVFDDQMKLLMVTELFEDWIQNEIQDMVNKLQNWHNY